MAVSTVLQLGIAQVDESQVDFETLIEISGAILLVGDAPFQTREATAEMQDSPKSLQLERKAGEQRARQDGIGDRTLISDVKIRRMRVVEVFRGAANAFVYLPQTNVSHVLDNDTDKQTLFLMFLDGAQKKTLVPVTDKNQHEVDRIRALFAPQ